MYSKTSPKFVFKMSQSKEENGGKSKMNVIVPSHKNLYQKLTDTKKRESSYDGLKAGKGR